MFCCAGVRESSDGGQQKAHSRLPSYDISLPKIEPSDSASLDDTSSTLNDIPDPPSLPGNFPMTTQLLPAKYFQSQQINNSKGDQNCPSRGETARFNNPSNEDVKYFQRQQIGNNNSSDDQNCSGETARFNNPSNEDAVGQSSGFAYAVLPSASSLMSELLLHQTYRSSGGVVKSEPTNELSAYSSASTVASHGEAITPVALFAQNGGCMTQQAVMQHNVGSSVCGYITSNRGYNDGQQLLQRGLYSNITNDSSAILGNMTALGSGNPGSQFQQAKSYEHL